MARSKKLDARLYCRLPAELRELILAAAACRGQSVNEFAVTTLVRRARQVVHRRQITPVSSRDYRKPNKKLQAAAERYKRQIALHGSRR